MTLYFDYSSEDGTGLFPPLFLHCDSIELFNNMLYLKCETRNYLRAYIFKGVLKD